LEVPLYFAKVLLVASLILSQVGLANTELTQVKNEPSFLGYIANSVGLLSGFYTLHCYRTLYRKHPKNFPVLKTIKAALTGIQIIGNGFYLTGFDTKLSKEAGEAILMRDTVKLTIAIAYGSVHYGTNLLFSERTGLAKLLYLYDIWALYGYKAELVEHWETLKHGWKNLNSN
jgi:hypothetical protein